MDQASAQTEKIASYETSRTRRSIVDGNIHSDDSNNDEEYASSGFYVREKTTEKRPDSATSASKDSDKDCKENGISPDANCSSSPKENGENSGDGESSRDSKNQESPDKNVADLEKQTETQNEAGPKEDIEPEKDDNAELSEVPAEGKQESENEDEEVKQNPKKIVEDTEDCDKSEKNVSSSTNEENVSSSTIEENVSSTTIEETVSSSSEHAEEQTKEEEEEKVSSKDLEKETNIVDESVAEEDKEKDAKKSEKQCATLDERDTSSKENDEKKSENQSAALDERDISSKENDEKKSEKQSAALDEKDISSISDDNEKKTDENKDEINKDKKEDDKSKENEKQGEADSSIEIAEEKSDKTVKDSEESVSKDDKGNEVEMKDAKEEEKSEGGSILKEQLEKSSSGNIEENEEMEMDEDFDPLLLCPDISMDVDEAPVITNNEHVPDDGSTSPLPYEATFSTLVDEITGAEVQVDLTPEEMELRQKMYGPNNLVQTTKIHCTACNIHLGSALTGANNRFVHPLLKVLICKNCYHFYTSGEFEKDEDGSELYCRWCGQGGQVLCCSSCEFVFCKRCIRNNFGPKKFKEIRDSDDWSCFRCDRGQLSNLRASCAEFMEYYRTELARAQSLSQTNPELMTTDYTRCCRASTEKKEEVKAPAPQKNNRRKRKDEEDPDYQPVVEGEEEPPKKKPFSASPSGGPGYTVIPPGGLRPVAPKPASGQVARPVVVQQGSKPQTQGQVFKVGNTTFRTRAPLSGQGYTVQRPTMTQGQKSNSPGYITIPPSSGPKTTSPGYITIPPSAAPKTTSPGYIKILPQRMQGPRPTNSYTVVSGTNNGKPTFTTVRPKQAAPMPAMKHEWFEKTVRAAARVNSNLSYTLTQLNRQQSQANSVEALAMVHNKLQEVLSTSINSLIQIRKNLRTEFISGIKNIKFPPKPAPIPHTTGPIVVKDDDDVIFVNPTKTANQLPPPPPLVLSPSVTLTKKTPIQKTSDPFADPKPSTSGVSGKTNSSNNTSTTSSIAPMKGGFLKVRSFTALQSVPSECITIPDDPPAAPSGQPEEEEDPLKLPDDDDKPKEDEPEIPKSPTPEPPSGFDEFMVYNVKDEPTPQIKKMLNAVVMVKKSRVVDEIIRAQGLLSAPDKKVKENESGKKGKDSEKESNKKEKRNESDAKEKEKESTCEEEKGEKKQSETKEKEELPDEKEKDEEAVKEDSAKSEEVS